MALPAFHCAQSQKVVDYFSIIFAPYKLFHSTIQLSVIVGAKWTQKRLDSSVLEFLTIVVDIQCVDFTM